MWLVWCGSETRPTRILFTVLPRSLSSQALSVIGFSKKTGTMKECPKCGTLDDPHWRPRIFDFEVDFYHLSDLEIFMPELAAQLKDTKAGSTITQGVYVYKKTKKTHYVWRMWKPLFDVRGWAPKYYYDSAGSARSASHKTAFHLSRVKNIVRSRDQTSKQSFLLHTNIKKQEKWRMS